MSHTPSGLSRRQFLKGLTMAGAASLLPLRLLMPYTAQAATAFNAKDFQVFRNACPRNCYDTCSIKTYVKENLARHKVPRDVVFIDELPRNATGKLLRRVLVEMDVDS